MIFDISTLGGSFSSVWTATIARVGAFFSIFRALQDLHSFAPLQIQKFCKKLPNFFLQFPVNFHKFAIFQVNFVVFRPDFDENLSEFQEIAAKYCKMLIFQKKKDICEYLIFQKKQILL